MTMTILVSTWDRGLVAVRGGALREEISGCAVAGLTSDRGGGALAIAGGSSLRQRSSDGRWATIGTTDAQLVCCTVLGDRIFAGTDDARVLRLTAEGSFEELRGFADVPGRHTWYAGSAIVDGRRIGPPLGIRSMTATSDHAALLVNVHVGGIPRSTDAGATWLPTIDIETDVHQVCAHPTRPALVIAAAAAGLCVSHDGGATWSIETAGMHASYCSAVAFCRDDILVAASTDHFAAQGAIYRRPIASTAPLERVGGLPHWLAGIADTDTIAVDGSRVVVADRGGALYLSEDAGVTWAAIAHDLGSPSSVLIF